MIYLLIIATVVLLWTTIVAGKDMEIAKGMGDEYKASFWAGQIKKNIIAIIVGWVSYAIFF